MSEVHLAEMAKSLHVAVLVVVIGCSVTTTSSFRFSAWRNPWRRAYDAGGSQLHGARQDLRVPRPRAYSVNHGNSIGRAFANINARSYDVMCHLTSESCLR